MVFEDWEEESMIQEAYYSYEFTKTKKEEVILSFNNGKYNVEINYNNNTISSIHAIDQAVKALPMGALGGKAEK